MNNTTKLLAAAVVMSFAMMALPGVMSQGSNLAFGSLVKFGDADFVPTVTNAAVIETVGLVHYQGDTATLDDDIYAIDSVVDDGNFDAYEIVVWAGSQARTTYPWAMAGGVVPLPVPAELNAGSNSADRGVQVFALDAGDAENGFYSFGDSVLVCNAQTVAAANAAGTTFCIWLVHSSKAGQIVTNADAPSTLDTQTKIPLDTSALATFDADGDGFKARNGDRAWMAGCNATMAPCASLTTGDILPEYSVRLIGGTWGSQVRLGDAEFVPTVKVAVAVLETTDDLAMYSDDATSRSEDFYFLELDNGGDLDRYEIILAAGSTAHVDYKTPGTSVQGTPVAPYTTLGGQGGALTVEVFALDMNVNGFYDAGDRVLVCEAATVHATSIDGKTTYCIELTAPNAGKVYTSADSLQILQTQSIIHLNAASIIYYDADGDNVFKGKPGELAWLAPVAVTAGQTVPQFSIRIFGGTFGSQVMYGDNDYVPTQTRLVPGTNTGLSIDADVTATTDLVSLLHWDDEDDGLGENFVALDMDASGTLTRYDLVVAAGPSAPAIAKVGMPLPSDLSSLGGAGNCGTQPCSTVVTADVFAIDMGDVGNGFFDNEDVVVVCDNTSGGANDTTLGVRATAADGDPFCFILAGPNAGKILSSADAALIVDLNSRAKLDVLDNGEISFYDANGDGVFKGDAGEMVWLSRVDVSTQRYVQLFSARLFGDAATFQNPVVSSSSTTTTTTTDDVTTTTTTTTTDGTVITTTTTTDGTVITTTTTTDGVVATTTTSTAPTPGLELLFLVGALGAALVLVRRKL